MGVGFGMSEVSVKSENLDSLDIYWGFEFSCFNDNVLQNRRKKERKDKEKTVLVWISKFFLAVVACEELVD